jgi:hypothetical protein
MKKQIFIVVGVLVTALLLFGLYEFVFKTDSAVDLSDSFYTLTDPVANEIKNIEDKVEIVFSGVSEESVQSDEYLNRTYKYALVFNNENKNIKVKFDEDSSYKGVVVKKDGSQKQIAFNDFYKTFSNGTKYAFDGERLYTNAILSLLGKEELAIELRALDGYDTDGDMVVASTKRPFLYPNIDRSKVQSITVKNQNGTYKTYRGSDNKFYFEGAELVSYDSEKFSNLIVNSTYVLASGKVKDPLELSVYGLDDEDKATAVITVITTDKLTHKIIIGSKTAAGNSYYAKYYTKDIVYIISESDLNMILNPVTDFFTQKMVYGISSQNDLYNIKNISIDYLSTNQSLKMVAHSKLSASSNLKVYGETDIAALLTNKLGFTGTYTKWTEISSLAGFTSSDGKTVYIEAPLALYGNKGDYTVSFGLLRDDSESAVLPKSFKAAISTDGTNYTDVDTSSVSFNQGNKELKSYSFGFHSDAPVKSVRLYFDVTASKYIIMDELTIKVDGMDTQPDDGVTGGWKLVGPADYIPTGRNYIYPTTEFSSDVLLYIATLTSEKVADYGITKLGDPSTLKTEKLAKYGLDKPDKHISFEYNGVKSDIYFSKLDENGYYYFYSIISGESGGQKINICTDVIAAISAVNATWLNWDTIDYLDHSLVSMYIDSIDTLTLSFKNKDYVFTLHKGDNGKLSKVTYEGKEVDLLSFRHMYISILSVYIHGEYGEVENTPTEEMKINIQSSSKNQEIIFYRVTTSKAYYTVNGEGRYYVLVDSISKIQRNVQLLIEGKEVKNK